MLYSFIPSISENDKNSIIDDILNHFSKRKEFSNGRCGEFATACGIMFDWLGIESYPNFIVEYQYEEEYSLHMYLVVDSDLMEFDHQTYSIGGVQSTYFSMTTDMEVFEAELENIYWYTEHYIFSKLGIKTVLSEICEVVNVKVPTWFVDEVLEEIFYTF